jgi:hypothetical protein
MSSNNSQKKYKYFDRNAILNRGHLFSIPLPTQVAGDIRLGYIQDTFTIFCILFSELVQHLLLLGRSGAGKTNVLRIIQLELFRLGIPFLCFDLAKYNTRYLKKYIPELIIIRWNKEFFMNVFEPPPGISVKEWLLTFCEVTSEAFGLFAASKSLLIELVESLYVKFDSENTHQFPSLKNFMNALTQRRINTKSRIDIDYVDRVKNKFTAIDITLGPVLNVKSGIPLEELLKKPVCLELVGVNSAEIQTWIVTLIMAWISLYRSKQAGLGELKSAIFYDEAAKAFGKGNL